MANICWKWIQMSGIAQIWKKMLDMAGTDYKWLKRAAELLKSGWTWLEIAGNALQWL